MIAIDIKATQDFSLPGDTTIFKLGLFDTALRTYLSKQIAKGNVEGGEALQYMLDLVRFGLKGWNLTDVEGKPVEFKTEPYAIAGIGNRPAVTLATLDHLDSLTIAKLGEAIGNLNFVREKVEKNLPPPSA